ncbi:MAG: ABC transporter permease [Emergencia sp.]
MTEGTLKVYRFTLMQMLKNRSNKVVFGILLLAAALCIPGAGLFLGDRTAEVSAYVEISTVEDYLAGGSIDYDTRYGIQYAYSIIALIICVFSVTYIVRAIVEEKASRLVETLMTSVQPLALILGKILAVMTFIFAMLILTAAVLALSCIISSQFMDVSFVSGMLASAGIDADVLNAGADVPAVALVSLLLAYMLFSLIAGLAGAGCSNMDEIESANLAAMGMILAGYIIASIAAAFDGAARVFFALCPVISAFTTPAYYIFDDIGIGLVAVSWFIELVCIAGLLLLTGRVYDRLILYKGTRLKLGKILFMAAGPDRGGAAAVRAGKRRSGKGGGAK